ncbi:conserved exported hypothetical protein [Candidatus Terasakiella magnetica]|nr:conserved exported hypothetical protein [Candidatus Terasakiella magnetica]
MMHRTVLRTLLSLCVLSIPLAAAVAANPPKAATPAAPAAAKAAIITVQVIVDNFALEDQAPVRNGFGPFRIEAVGLLPAPKKRESFTPTEDEHFYPLKRTVERALQSKEIPVGWSISNEASFSFKTELDRLRNADGIAYAVEGELVLRGDSPIPLGLSLTAPKGGPPLRYAVGLQVGGQVLVTKEGMIDEDGAKASWMLSVHPNGPTAAVPVRAVFAVRAETEDRQAGRTALAALTAALTSSSDGRAASAERSDSASQWLKPVQMFLKPDQVKGGAKGAKKEEKKEGGAKH